MNQPFTSASGLGSSVDPLHFSPNLPSRPIKPTQAKAETPLAHRLLNLLLEFKRTDSSQPVCPPTCPRCTAVHLAQIHQSVQQNQPLTLILPAFPAKSPNLAKVLGHTPDLGEELSLQFLQQICNRIKQMYAPGAHLPYSQPSQSLRMYLGITRFLVEDATHPHQTLSRTALQKECKERAYVVIQRSQAWSALLEKRFPQAIRLSIHPQGCGSPKLGIRLIANETWLTPWHGVVVQKKNEFILMKRFQAEASGARLVHYPNGRPSHFIWAGEVPGSESEIQGVTKYED